MWKLVVGVLVVAMGLTGWGLLSMDINVTYKALLGVSWLYLITTAFTLAKDAARPPRGGPDGSPPCRAAEVAQAAANGTAN